jgi:two-component system, OmpR family, sensor histidine kinase KdpD
VAAGRLRVYLGAAPGVGKTYKMLEEGRRRLGRGTDVVVGYVEAHGRPQTEVLVEGLGVVPRARLAYHGVELQEMDVDAVLARRPEVAIVDELAHTNAPGSRHEKRWQDVQELMAAGITVITTVNVQHLESLNDVVHEITGVLQHETVPDEVVRRADQIELVDITPDALRRRLAHGNVYPPETIDAALGNYFQPGNLTVLRELALLWLAGNVDEELDRYRAEHGIATTWDTRERVVVALTGGPEGDTLVRRATRIAARTKGAELLAVHVARGDGLAGGDAAHLARQRALVESHGGTYHLVVGNDVPGALLEFARGVNATQLVLGASRRGRLAQMLAPGVGTTTAARSGPVDVHLVTHEEVAHHRPRSHRERGLSAGRRAAGFGLALVGLPLLTLLLLAVQPQVSLATDILAFLLSVVAVAIVGGLPPALFAAVIGFLLLNYWFTPPLHRLEVAARENVLALVAFLVVAVAVSGVVDLAARRTREAARARAEAATLFTLAGSVLRGRRPVPALLDQLRETFALTDVTLLERVPDSTGDASSEGAWRVLAFVGVAPAASPADGDAQVTVGSGMSLVLRGHPLDAADRRVVEAFAAQAAVALRQERLAEQAATAQALAEVDRLRTALLNAVSHDLRTPLASATAAVSSLRSADVAFTEEDREELLATAEESLDRLRALVENLLDMSRLQSGALALSLQPIGVAEVVPGAVDAVGPAGSAVAIRIPDDIPDVLADPALLERALANLVANALRFSPPGSPPLVTASALGGRVELRVVDRGPGVPPEDWDRIFLPFQRLDDRDNTTGVGLGLALSRGLVEAMSGTLVPAATPGGGLTMTISLPAAPAREPAPDADEASVAESRGTAR